MGLIPMKRVGFLVLQSCILSKRLIKVRKRFHGVDYYNYNCLFIYFYYSYLFINLFIFIYLFVYLV